MEALTPYLLIVISFLGSPIYRTRLNAFNHLSRLDSVPILLLMQNEKHKDKEISSRCKLIVDRWIDRNAEEIVKHLKPKGWDNYPWICTRDDDGEWRYTGVNLYMEGLRNEGYQDNTKAFPMWSEGTRRWLVDLVKNRENIEYYMTILCDKHRQWCRENNYPVPPE